MGGGSPAASLEGVSPTLAYYKGSNTSAPALPGRSGAESREA